MVLGKGLTSFFCSEYSVFSAQFVERTVLFLLNVLNTLVKTHLAVYLRAYFEVLHSISNYLYVGTHCFDYCSFVV